ncbi:NAD(P)H-binding protein [Paenibacillus sp. sgz302251]|uniref:NAD(P)H-binding protein n=1 Tax=Paenibacillus sp. sgz302251 TaxID=3414493 RepID=UPI003C79A9EE
MGKKALVAGATGLVGQELVDLLLNHNAYHKVIVLVRREMNITHPKLEQQIIDFEQLEHLSPDLVAGADIFCALGTTIKKAKTKQNFMRVDYDYPMTLGRLAKRHGAEKMLIVTAMGASEKSMFFYSRVKGKVEEDLKGLGLDSLHIFRPSLITGDRQEHRFGEQAASAIGRKLPFLFKGKMEKYKPIAARTIAQAMVNAAASNIRSSTMMNSDEMARLSVKGLQ